MNYGYFDDPDREYVITDPRTPTKWINYIGTLQFGGLVDLSVARSSANKTRPSTASRNTSHITVTNPKHVCKGVENVRVNGRQGTASLVRADEGASKVYVEVTLG
jgi:hypothetical protein